MCGSETRGFCEPARDAETRHAEPKAGAMAKQRVGSNKADAHIKDPTGIAGLQHASHISHFVQVIQAASLASLYRVCSRCDEMSVTLQLVAKYEAARRQDCLPGSDGVVQDRPVYAETGIRRTRGHVAAEEHAHEQGDPERRPTCPGLHGVALAPRDLHSDTDR